ncbi:hypothetical protein TRVA0_002S04346 [Trichomonascus vanleenenianus]|uniref:Sld3p n=1 Tax=Trichomonascus vanleenenianus TaxID=2268995 RepID=UPI003ECB676A
MASVYEDSDTWAMRNTSISLQELGTVSPVAARAVDWIISPDFSKVDQLPTRYRVVLAPPDAPEEHDAPPAWLIDSDTPMGVLESKYFESLYASKHTSLAYFAKSTLAKLRALCKDRCASKKDYVQQLCEVLRGAIYKDMYLLDAKYDFEAMQGFIENRRGFPGAVTSELEKWYLGQWKKASRVDAIADELEELKLREIQLQVILLLELISIEQLVNRDKPQTPPPKRPVISLVRQKRKPLSENQESQDPQPAKDISPNTMVDLMFDRLCIWQVLDEPVKNADPIREFCMQVLVPYFGNKLPARITEMTKRASGSRARLPKSSSHESAAKRKTPIAAKNIASEDTTPQKAARQMSRGGLLVSAKTQQRRQVEMTSSIKRNQPTAEDLAAAIRSVAKPNRDSAVQEYDDSRKLLSFVGARKRNTSGVRKYATTSIAKPLKRQPVVQVHGGVAMTPCKKRIQSDSVTPSKKHRVDESPVVISTPTQERVVISSSPVKVSFHDRLRRLGSHHDDTDDDNDDYD